jgi:autotransporter-associated beta strand protein
VAQDWELNCSGIISGSGSLAKWGAGTLRLSGSGGNSYSGDTLVNAGPLILAKGAAITAVPGRLIVGESNGGAPAKTSNSASYQIFGGIIVNSQGFYDVNSQTENTDYLIMNGNAVVDTSGGSLILKTGATVDVAPGINTTAYLNGFVRLDPGNHLFTVAGGTNSPGTNDLVVNAQITQQSTSAGIEKAGPGRMRLTGINTYAGTTTVSGGTLQVDGSQPQSPVQILGARLQGSGTVGNIAFGGNAAERLAPGSSPGILTSSNLNANAVGGGTVEIELNGATPGTGYDQVNVRGAVNLNGLKLSPSLGFLPAPGTQFTIINNDGSDSVTGTFSGLAQNAKFYIGGHLFQINYAGGSGNDVVLTQLAAAAPPVLTLERASTNSFRLRWPTNDPPFRLVTTTNLSATNWSQALPLPIVSGTNNIVTNAATAPASFYRLVSP